MNRRVVVKIAIIVLAAGNSSRLGSSKQLLAVNDSTLLQYVASEALASATDQLVIVLGSEYDQHKQALHRIANQEKVDIIHNTNWEQGMGSSIKTGLSHLMKIQPSTEAIIISVCDQPYLTSVHFDELMAKYKHFEGKNVVASSYGKGEFGVPVLIGEQLFPEILTIDNRKGAKRIIQKHLDSTVIVTLEKGKIDIDTEEDYQRFLKDNITK